MATLNLQVGHGDDDARETSGTMYLDQTTVIMGSNSPGTWAAVRFSNVTIDPGSTVTAATLSLYVGSTTYDSPDVDIYADDVDNSARPTTSASNLSTRALTTAKVTWTATNIGTGWKSPGDLTTVIQEIIDRGGWASGNAITLLLDARSISNDIRWDAYDGTPANAAKLDITYTPGAATGQPMIARARFVPGLRRTHGHQGW